MPTGTSLTRTEEVVTRYTEALQRSSESFSHEGKPALTSVTVIYNSHADAFEQGAHLATISVDMLKAEARDFSLNEFMDEWRQQVGQVPDAWSVSLKEPSIGPSGRAIDIRLQGANLSELTLASQEIQDWLSGYPGVNNLMDENANLSFDRERGGRARLGFRTNKPRTIGVRFGYGWGG